MSITTEATVAELNRAGYLVEGNVRPDGTFDGWDGRDVHCHLAAYTRLVGAVLRSTAEHRLPSNTELYGRELTDEQLAAPGPAAPPNWWRQHLADVVTVLVQHYQAHMAHGA